jgi:hypothetical protein
MVFCFMEVKEFERWIKQGLGRAVTRLRAEEDKSPFYGVVLRVAQRQPDFTHCSANYIFELIHCFDDSSELEDTAVQSSGYFFGSTDCEYRIAGDDLLAMLYTAGNKKAGEKLEKLYCEIFAELFARTEQVERKHDKMFAFTILSFRIALADGAERLRGLLLDMGALFAKRELFDEQDFLNFFDNTRFRCKNIFYETLDSLRSESSEVTQLADRMAELREECQNNYKQNRVVPQLVWSFEKLYELVSSGEKIPLEFYRHTNELTDEQKIKLALLANSMSELKRKREVLSIFKCNDVPWPLEPELLVRMTREYLYSYGKEKPKCEEKLLTSTLISVLRNVRSDCVREFGFELIKRGFVREGITLWAKNYRPDDRERFLDFYNTLDFKKYERKYPTPQFEVLDLIRRGEFSEPAQLFTFMYENSYGESFRYVLLLEMNMHGLVTDAMISECLHDNWENVREYAEWLASHPAPIPRYIHPFFCQMESTEQLGNGKIFYFKNDSFEVLHNAEKNLIKLKNASCGEITLFDAAKHGYDAVVCGLKINQSEELLPFTCTDCGGGMFRVFMSFQSQGKETFIKEVVAENPAFKPEDWVDAFDWITVNLECAGCGRHLDGWLEYETS